MAAGAPPASEENDASLPKSSLYEGSTQFRHWRFSPEQLASARASLNATAVTAIRNAFEADSLGSSSEVLFLNADEENLLVKLYVSKVTQLCGLFRFPEEVEATAMTYLKRFYLKNTVMDWHPKNVMLTALFLATKTTNHPIPLEAYTSRIPKTSPSDVLDLEFLVAQSLGFDFAVWHAHRALWGIWLDVQTIPDISMEDFRKAYEVALKHVRASRLTDAEFIYAPSQIALACLSLAAPQIAAAWATLKQDCAQSPSSTPSAALDDGLLALLEPIKTMILTHGLPPNVEAVREVDRRLKICKNPEKIIGSSAYKRKQEEQERKAEAKRLRKAEIVRKAMADGDPFGNELAKEDLDDDDDDE